VSVAVRQLILAHEGKLGSEPAASRGAADERFLRERPPTVQVQRLEKHLAREIGGLCLGAPAVARRHPR
jgi:hypothetical protein